MSEMLNMVKPEMILVNEADADRGTIEEYLIELEECQNKQLSMISTHETGVARVLWMPVESVWI